MTSLRQHMKTKRWMILVAVSIPFLTAALTMSLVLYSTPLGVPGFAFAGGIILWSAGTGVFLLVVGIRERTYQQWSFRSRRNLCLQCGYDLRGTATGDCPECGFADPSRTAKET